jgi:WD40 repeat protein
VARNHLTGTHRAIKIIWRDAFETPKPYEREFEAISRFEPISRSHPGFVHVLQTGRLNNGFYYIMELADDVDPERRDVDVASYQPATLAAIKGNLDVEQAIRVGMSLTESLEVLHQAGLIHRDIKPSNVIFVRHEPKLADIGLVTEISEANSVVGTNGFIAPEGPTTNRADIYSLGKLLYEIATGRDRLDFPLLPEDVSRQDRLLLELNQVLIKACNPDPAQRHPSVQALRDELELLIQGRSIRRVRQLEKTLRLTKAWFATTCALVVAGYFLLKSNEAKRTAEASILEGRIATAIAEGNHSVAQGDYLGSVHSFAQAALLDKKHPREQRLRLGSALAYAPRRDKTFPGDPEITACFAERANVLGSVLTNHIRLTDIESGRMIHEFDRTASSLAIDPQGRCLAIAEKSCLSLINLTSWDETLLEFRTNIWHVSIVDPEHFAVTTEAGEAFLFPGHRRVPNEGAIYKAILSPSGRRLCLLENNNDTKVLDALTFKESCRGHHDSLAYDALFFNNEESLITCGSDRTAIVRDVATGLAIQHFVEDKGAVTFASVSPDGTRLATGCEDNTVKLWNATTFAALRENQILYHPNRVVWVKFAANSSLVVHCTDGTTYSWALKDPALPTEVPRTFNLPDRKRLIAHNTLLVGTSNNVTGAVEGKPFFVTVPGAVETIAADARLELIAVGTRDDSQAPHSVWLFDHSGHQVGQPMPHTDGITYVTFSHSGKVIASCGEDFAARLWNREGESLHIVLRHKHQVRWISFSANDDWVVTGSWDETVRVWNAHSGFPITVPLKVDNSVAYVAFESDNELFVANQIRNYRMQLPYFEDSLQNIFTSFPPPLEREGLSQSAFPSGK